MPHTTDQPGTRRTGARILGLGAARAGGLVTAEQLVGPFGKSAQWLAERTGIAGLRRLAAGERLVDLALAAARASLADAAVAVSDVETAIDMVLVATCTADPDAGPFDREPLAAELARQLAPGAAAVDLNAICAGFCYALSQAAGLIGTGSVGTVLVVGAEQMSRVIDPAELGTSILFGDGAGAAVVTACEADQAGIGPAAWSSDGSLTALLEIPAGDRYMRMRGPEVFRWAIDQVPAVAAAACAKAEVKLDDIEVFVPHQANLRIVDALARRLGLEHAVVARDIVDAGNTSSASVPLALVALRERGLVRPGQLALLVGFGAGLSIAAQVVRLP